MLKQVELANMFRDSGAFLTGHFLLTSGLHSPHYFQCAKVLQYPSYSGLLGRDIASNFSEENIDAVVSPAVGGIVIGQEAGRALDKRAVFSERSDDGMVLKRGFSIEPGEKVIIVEDVLTTGRSIKEVIAMLEKTGCDIRGVGVIVDRSGGRAEFDYPLFSLFKMEVITHQPDECPICREGKIMLEKPGSRKVTGGER
ncbi:MAG: orotate phosphoribosyltransferase [Fibrobacterota bacterium]